MVGDRQGWLAGCKLPVEGTELVAGCKLKVRGRGSCAARPQGRTGLETEEEELKAASDWRLGTQWTFRLGSGVESVCRAGSGDLQLTQEPLGRAAQKFNLEDICDEESLVDDGVSDSLAFGFWFSNSGARTLPTCARAGGSATARGSVTLGRAAGSAEVSSQR